MVTNTNSNKINNRRGTLDEVTATRFVGLIHMPKLLMQKLHKAASNRMDTTELQLSIREYFNHAANMRFIKQIYKKASK